MNGDSDELGGWDFWAWDLWRWELWGPGALGTGSFWLGSFGSWDLWGWTFQGKEPWEPEHLGLNTGASISCRAGRPQHHMPTKYTVIYTRPGGICSGSVRATHASKARIRIHLQQPDTGQTASCVDQAHIGTGPCSTKHGKHQTQVEHNAGHDQCCSYKLVSRATWQHLVEKSSNRCAQRGGCRTYDKGEALCQQLPTHHNHPP